ncbi:hypothetical protein J6590_012317 [Homalodisca vitripennis]|nr:hypothetical protein J6590_012317 [Homalodisca vitripennis]
MKSQRASITKSHSRVNVLAIYLQLGCLASSLSIKDDLRAGTLSPNFRLFSPGVIGVQSPGSEFCRAGPVNNHDRVKEPLPPPPPEPEDLSPSVTPKYVVKNVTLGTDRVINAIGAAPAGNAWNQLVLEAQINKLRLHLQYKWIQIT